jgi:holo-[acyl-carrier protein] synthase
LIRVGIDVVDIARLDRRLREFPRLAGRLFTLAEAEYCYSRPYPADHLAARFAAKEATFKALGVGWPRLSWHQVEVVTRGFRQPPQLRLSGRAADLAGECTALVSLAHDGGIAMAEVLLIDSKVL